jgi:hypothetical protein
MYICLCFSFLSQVLTRRGLVASVSWKMRLSLVRQAGGKYLRCAPFGCCSERRLRSWFEDGACDVRPGVGSMGIPEWSVPVCEPDAPPRGTDARTGGPALGPADRSLLSSACCGTELESLLLPCEKTFATKIGVVF